MKNFLILANLLWAINASGMGQAKTPAWPYCEETVELFDIKQETPLGFSGLDLFTMASGINAVKIDYGYKQAPTVGTLAFTQTTSLARYIRSKAVYPSPGFEIGIICRDRVELDINLAFMTQDGAFRDSWDTTLRSQDQDYCRDEACAVAGEYAQFSLFLSPEEFQGTFYQDASEEWVGEYFLGSYVIRSFPPRSAIQIAFAMIHLAQPCSLLMLL